VPSISTEEKYPVFEYSADSSCGSDSHPLPPEAEKEYEAAREAFAKWQEILSGMIGGSYGQEKNTYEEALAAIEAKRAKREARLKT
jgi:hypothetical protein